MLIKLYSYLGLIENMGYGKVGYGLAISVWMFTLAASGVSHAAENNPENAPLTIQTIDSDALVDQFWNLDPSPVEAIVLKRRQRAKK